MEGGGRENQDPLSFPSHGHNLSVGSFGMDILCNVQVAFLHGLVLSLPALRQGGRSWVLFPKWLQVRFGLSGIKARYVPRTLGLRCADHGLTITEIYSLRAGGWKSGSQGQSGLCSSEHWQRTLVLS